MPEDKRQKNPLAERSGRRLRLARELAGYRTQEEAAAAAGIEPGTYGQYERGWVLVTSEALLRLRPVLHQTADYLLGLDDPCHLSPEERLLVDLFRETRNAGIRRSILEHARLQHDLDKSLPTVTTAGAGRGTTGAGRGR